ncbi:hypothetical protein AQUCO_01300023v1 [Aquilegia coerulea]|uniref:Rab-GAP TBC domain-containing protein n=1 Tax=Aquilegia coerulea TaxID=218851 RepID=A0A2G5DZW2_AQUCA|nr:hypothetical protein AQUCO_01300023v1 [Aquilegia coerulea]
MVVGVKVKVGGLGLNTVKVTLVVVLSMIWWNSDTTNRISGLLLLVEGSNGGGIGSRNGGGGILSRVIPSNVGIAVAVTAMAGIALAATLVYSHRGSLKSPWSRKRRKNPLSPQQWKNLFTPDGQLRDGGVRFLKKVRSGFGCRVLIQASEKRYDLNSTQEERDAIRNEKRNEYENLRRKCMQVLSIDSNDTNSNGGVNQGLNSPGSDVDSARESICIDQENQECNVSDRHIRDRTSHTPNSLAEEDDQSAITNVDQIPVVMELSDSDSNEETETTLTSPLLETSNGNDPIRPSKENSSHSNGESKSKAHTDEDFVTWQRIIRLDAVRANAEWIVYSPSQAAVSESKARESAEAVGLKDYDHLEPCRIFHASRLVAILEAYALFDPEIGYCQGMSDLLTPIIAVIDEDHEAFWCFVGFMKKARHNFRLDEVGIRRQLNIVSKIIKSKDSHLYRHLQKLEAEDCFFVYRMVVVLFRRELTFEQTIWMWEVMWADQAAIRAGISKSAWGKIRLRAPPTEDLLLYAIAACVLQRRKLIIEKYSSMDEIMRECNSMAGHLDVWKLLDDAHDLVVTLHDKI